MKKKNRLARHKKIRKTITGTRNRPRLLVFRSSQHIYAQVIDDSAHRTIISSSDIKETHGTKKERALRVGLEIADKATKAKIKQVVFDRGGFKYHGRIAAVAEGARQGGLDL